MGGGDNKSTTAAPSFSSVRIQTTVLGRCIPWVFGTPRVAPNVIQIDDFVAVAHKTRQQGGKGGGGSSTTTSYTYNAACVLGLCIGEIDGVGRIWKNKEILSAAGLNFDVYTGSPTQNPHPHWGTTHRNTALSYRGLAYVASSSYDMGDNGEIPSHNIEVFSKSRVSTTNPDARIDHVLTQILTDKINGIGISPNKIGDLTQLHNFTEANSLWVSPAYVEQIEAQEAITRLVDIAQSQIFLSEGKVKFVPYSDATFTSNGVTFKPNATPIYDLTEDHFLSGDPAVKIVRSSIADADNHLQITYYDRANEYNEATVEASDIAHIEKYGLRTKEPDTYHEICTADVAQKLVNFQKDRSLAVRNQYEFSLPINFILLEPTDIVTLTSVADGLYKLPVRIVKISESDGDLEITAEDCPLGVQHPTQYPTQTNDRVNVDFNINPGNANEPVIYEPSLELTRGETQVWMNISGGGNWGGAEVYTSTDGNTYDRIGVVTNPSRQGYLYAPLPSGGVIDSANTLSVDLSASGGAVYSGTQQDALNGVTLCYVDGEMLAYQTATLTGVNKYTLDYLARGLYGTTISAHAQNAKFARVDDTTFKYTYTSAMVGKVIYLKLVSFNKFSTAKQSLADVQAIAYTIQGAPLSPPTNLQFQKTWVGKEAVIEWDLVPGADRYEVQVYTGTPAVLVRTVETVVEGQFIYTMDMVKVDGAPSRNIVFKVRARSVTGNVSSWVQVVGNNAQVGALQGLSITSGMRQAFFECTRPTDSDWAGIKVWLDISPNFVANDNSNLIYKGQTTFVTLSQTFAGANLQAGVTYYVRAAGFDEYGEDALTISASLPFTVAANVPDANTIQSTMIQDGVLTTAKFAQGIEPVTIVSGASLPSVKSTNTITWNNKLYYWNGTAYVAKVNAVDVQGQLTSAQIASLDATKVAGQLTDAQLSTISATKLTGQVVATQIADAAISTTKFASGIQPVTIVSGSTLPTVKLTDVITMGGKLYRWNGTAYTAQVPVADLAGQIVNTQIADDAITTPKLVANSVVAGKLAANSVVAGNVAADAITAGTISAGAISAREIAANAITSDKIVANAITTDKISASAVTAATIAVGAVTADAIAANAITAVKISAGAITAGKLAVDSVLASNIATGAVTADAISANAVTANKIAANAVTATHIAADSITSAQIAAGAISASELAAGAITASKIAISDITNLYPDMDMIDPSFYTSAGAVTFTGTTSTPLGQNYLNLSGVATVWSGWFPVDPSEVFYVTALAWVSAVAAGNSAVVGVDFGTLAENGVVTQSRSITLGTNTAAFNATTSKFVTDVTTTSSERRMRFWVQNPTGSTSVARAGGFRVQRKANGSLIVDGAITASKIVAGAISGDKIAANAITADKIVANSITTDKISASAITAATIAVGAVTANKIAAGAVTADKISVSSLSAVSANLGAVTAGSVNINNRFIVGADGTTTIQNATTGARLVLSNSLLQVYDANNVLRVKLGVW